MMSVPIIITIASFVSMVILFRLGHVPFIAIISAIAFEMAAISSLVGIFIIDKIPKRTLFLTFIGITVMQVLGNSYACFDYISNELAIDPHLLTNWINFFGEPFLNFCTLILRFINSNLFDIGVTINDPLSFHITVLSFIVGGVFPLFYLTFVHILVRYLSNTIKEENVTPVIPLNDPIMTTESNNIEVTSSFDPTMSATTVSDAAWIDDIKIDDTEKKN